MLRFPERVIALLAGHDSSLYESFGNLYLVLIARVGAIGGHSHSLADGGCAGSFGGSVADSLSLDGIFSRGGAVRNAVNGVEAYSGVSAADSHCAIDDGEVDGLSQGELEEGALGAFRRSRYLYLGDDLTGFQYG
jgi:hypothetical protein